MNSLAWSASASVKIKTARHRHTTASTTVSAQTRLSMMMRSRCAKATTKDCGIPPSWRYTKTRPNGASNTAQTTITLRLLGLAIPSKARL